LEIYHEKKSSTYEKAVNTEKGRDIENKYFITGNEATCPKCELKMDWTDLKHTEERLIKLDTTFLIIGMKKRKFVFICQNA